MNETYVHTLRYRYYGRNNRQSRTMFPISYGPFKDEDAAREWVRQRGLICATKLMSMPAEENIKIVQNHLAEEINPDPRDFIHPFAQQHSPA